MKFIFVIAAIAAVVFAFKTNLYVGIVVSLAVLAYAFAKGVPLAYQIKSRKAFSDGKFDEAKRCYEKALKYLGYTFDSQTEYAYILLRSGDFEKAKNVMDKLLSHKMKPQNRNLATVQRCMCYYKTGNLDEAYNDALELYNDGYRTMTLYGLLGYFKILKAPLSDDTFEFCLEAYDYANDDRDICDNLLICYYNRGEYEKAKEISDSIIEKEPKFIEAWYHAAQVEAALGNFETAKENLDKISGCIRSQMTTISEEDVNKLVDFVDKKLKEKPDA